MSILGMLDVLTIFKVYGKNSRFRRPATHLQCTVQNRTAPCSPYHQGLTNQFWPPGPARAPYESGTL